MINVNVITDEGLRTLLTELHNYLKTNTIAKKEFQENVTAIVDDAMEEINEETVDAIWNEGNDNRIETLSVIEKTKLTITGVTSESAPYDGSIHYGYTGLPTAEGYNGKFSVYYTGRLSTEYASHVPPIDVGAYNVSFYPTDPDYTGTLTLPFRITAVE